MFVIKVYAEAAEKEVSALLDKKNIFPKRREQLQPVIEAVIEAITYGFVAIAEDGSIVQTLVTPVGGITELKYADRVAPAIMSKVIGALKVDNQSARNIAYVNQYTGILTATLEKLEPADRNIAESISLFFQ